MLPRLSFSVMRRSMAVARGSPLEDRAQDLVEADLLRQQGRQPENGGNRPVFCLQVLALLTHRSSRDEQKPRSLEESGASTVVAAGASPPVSRYVQSGQGLQDFRPPRACAALNLTPAW
jgi:hypothetical protein